MLLSEPAKRARAVEAAYLAPEQSRSYLERKSMSTYSVVSPLGRRVQRSAVRAARPRTLDGVTIGELSNHKFDSEFTFAVIEKAILKRFPKTKFVSFDRFGDTYGARESEVIRDLPEKLKLYGCDLVISGNAG